MSEKPYTGPDKARRAREAGAAKARAARAAALDPRFPYKVRPIPKEMLE